MSGFGTEWTLSLANAQNYQLGSMRLIYGLNQGVTMSRIR